MEKRDLKQYDINIFKLNDGEHHYSFRVNDDFFTKFENSLIEEGDVLANVTLHKSSSLISLMIHLKGSVVLTCDRSLDKFDYPINEEAPMRFKFGEEEQELSEDMAVIANNTQVINVAQFLYEYMGLALPMKKLHPRYVDEEDEGTEELKLIYTSKNNTASEKREEDIDPRWNMLKKLKDNKNNNK